jgi:hypothetical protein
VFFAKWSMAMTQAPARASGLSTRACAIVKSSGELLGQSAVRQGFSLSGLR